MSEHLKKEWLEFDPDRPGYEYEQDENYLFASQAYLLLSMEQREDHGSEYAFDMLVASIQCLHIHLEQQEREKARKMLICVDDKGTLAPLEQVSFERGRAAGAKEERERIVALIVKMQGGYAMAERKRESRALSGVLEDITAESEASNG